MNDKDVLDAAIDRALAPYAAIVPAETLLVVRETIAEYATTHPYPMALVRQLARAPARQRSAALPKDPSAEPVGVPAPATRRGRK